MLARLAITATCTNSAAALEAPFEPINPAAQSPLRKSRIRRDRRSSTEAPRPGAPCNVQSAKHALGRLASARRWRCQLPPRLFVKIIRPRISKRCSASSHCSSWASFCDLTRYECSGSTLIRHQEVTCQRLLGGSWSTLAKWAGCFFSRSAE
jgi:hypothetical protein